MPTALLGRTAALLPNGKVLVAAGLVSGSGGLASVAEYDPATGIWTATGSLATARYYHTATLLPNGKVLVAGGFNASSQTPLASAAVYDPATGTWTATGSLATARSFHTATLLPNGKVFVAWGYNYSSNTYLASAEIYDPAVGTWTTTGSMAVTRYGHTATLLPNGKVLVAGGDATARGTLASAAVYDPATGIWTATGSMPVARYYHTATLLPNGKVLVVGGDNNGGNSNLASAALYDPAVGTWTTTGSMAVARYAHTATLLPNGKVLVAGGYTGNASFASLASAAVYDPATGTWAATGSMAAARAGHSATLLQNGKVLVAGGDNFANNTSTSLASAELYTPDTGGPNAPDFVVTNITLTPATLGINTAFTAQVTVKNQGKSAGDGGNLLVWTNQNLAQTCGATGDKAVAVGTLAAGASKTLTVSGLMVSSAGTKTLRAFVDGGACVTLETNEANNQLTLRYRAHGVTPDFVVSAASLNPANPKPNSYFTATMVVTNQGTASASAGYLDVWADQPNVQSCGADGDAWTAVGTLAAGASKPVTVKLLAGPAGTKGLRAFVDSWCATSEPDESNNQSATVYTVK